MPNPFRLISIEFEGEDKIDHTIDFIEDAGNKTLYDLLDDVGDVARYWLRIYVPVDEGYIWEHVDKAGPRWHPGGAGGGGEYRVIVGVRDGTSRHPLYAALGTGIYATRPSGNFYGPGRGLIRPQREKYMTFYGKSGWRKKRTVRGQRPQRFLYMTFAQTRLYMNARILRFGQEMKFATPRINMGNFEMNS